MDQRSWKPLIRACLESGESTGVCEVLRNRSGGRGMLMRLSGPDETSVIVKAWASRNRKEHVKRLLGLSMARREWRVHRRIERAGLAVPRPLMFFHTRCSDGRRFEVVVVEDLGPTTNGLVYLKGLMQQGDEQGIRRFEDSVLAMTGRLIDAGIIDVDHQLRNIVINGSDRLTRIDFECALWSGRRGLPPETYGQMLARLVCSHVYACQPEVERTEAFAARLMEHLQPAEEVRNVARESIKRNLDRQRRTKGVDSQLRMNW